MSTPDFSVIIPVYNGAATLPAAIDSVLGQTYPAREIIVVDDGSVDGTQAVAQAFGSRVRYIYQPNSGVSTARNAGVRAAKGHWIAFLDADDYYYPDRLRSHAEFIRDDPDLDFLTGDFDFRDTSGRTIRRAMESGALGRSLLERADGSGRTVMAGEELGEFVARHFGQLLTLCLPRQTFVDLGGFPTQFAVCEDAHFAIRLCARAGRVGVVCNPMAGYTVHEQGATRSNPLRAQQQTVAALRDLKPKLKHSAPYIRKGLLEALRSARLDLASVLLRNGSRGAAVRAVLPLALERPGWRSVRDVLSVVRG